MSNANHTKRTGQDLGSASSTPTRSEADPIFFAEISSPPEILVAPTPVVHSQSKTWKSGDTKQREEFARLSTLLHYLVPKSPFVPINYGVWVEHRAQMSAMEVENMKRNIAIKQSRSTTAAKTAIQQPLDGKIFSDNRSAVLALETIWATWSTPTDRRPQALWPDRTELQYEGDDRAKSDVGRFLPLPRRPGNETVNWKAREQLQPYRPLDHVGMFQADGTPDIEMRQGVDGLRLAEEDWYLVETLLGKELLTELQ